MRLLTAVDMFAGAGGTSTGLVQALGGDPARVDLVAINHWEIALETHKRNHPWARHFPERIEALRPREVVPGGRVDLLVASPECTHHSSARGGKPINDQSRATAWRILEWCTGLRIENVLIENVPEFRSWGPLGANGRPLKSKKGETFAAFIRALASLNYAVEYRVLNCADFGDPTTRRRLFIVARRGRKRVRWPDCSHAEDPSDGLFGALPRWRAAREIIDWGLKGESIFARKRPLAVRTLERIAEGLRRFGGEAADPFLLLLRGTSPYHVRSSRRSVDAPVPTLTAGGGHVGLVEPFLIGQQSGAIPRPVSEPSPTVSAKGAISLIEPFLVEYYGNGRPRPVKDPVPTVTTKDRFALATPTQRLDILFRMLQPHELAAAMSFPAGYDFAGNKTEIVKQIGNAVPVSTAAALCRAILRGAA